MAKSFLKFKIFKPIFIYDSIRNVHNIYQTKFDHRVVLIKKCFLLITKHLCPLFIGILGDRGCCDCGHASY